MNKKVIIGILITLIIVVGLVVGVILVGRNQEIREKAAPATSLSITPGAQSKLPGQSFTLNVLMDTGENQVTGADIVLDYDPVAIEVVSISKGSGISVFDQEIKNNIDSVAGKVSYSAFTLNSANAISGSGVAVLTINAQVKSTATGGTFTISFGTQTAVAATQEGQNVLTSSTPASITVGVIASPTSTPTTAPTSTPTPTSLSNVDGGTTVTTSTSTPTPTTSAGTATLPDAGVSSPTVLGLGIGFLAILASIFLAI